MKKNSDISILVVWQSLVVPTYRSFFYKLRLKTPWRIGMVAPSEFSELGFQKVPCAPFKPPFSDGDSMSFAATLRVTVKHLQVVIFHGLRRVVRTFFAQASGRKVVFCVAEPYSPTALLVYLSCRLTLGRGFIFISFTCQNIKKDFALPLRMIQNFIFRRSKAIMALGEEQKEVLKAHGYKGRCVSFPLWYNSDRFRPIPRKRALSELAGHIGKDLGFQGKKVVIGYAGLIGEQKGVSDLMAALEMFAAGSTNGVAFLVAGAGPIAESIEARCRLLNEKGIAGHYLGPLPADQMPAFMNALDILVVPSRTQRNWKEQFGRIIVEALACGVSVIGSDSGEIPVVVNNPERIFPEGDVLALNARLQSLVELMADEADKARLREKAQQSVINRYSDTVTSERFEENILNIIGDL